MLLPVTDLLLTEKLRKDDKAFIDFLQHLGVELTHHGLLRSGMNWLRRKVFPDCTYIDVPQMGLSFAFDHDTEDEHLAAIHVFKNVRQYRYCDWLELPFGIKMTWTIKEVVLTLGEPPKKHGGRSVPITITYEPVPSCSRIGAQFEFVGTLWEDPDNELESITFFKI